MLLLVSGLIIILYTFILFIVGRSCSETSAKASKCIPMAYGMVASTAIGTTVTFMYPGNLVLTTIISILISFVLAAIVGMLYGLTGVIEALSASFMGAMMGAMLAAMVPVAQMSLLLIAIDLFFVLFIALLLIYLKQHSKQSIVVSMKKVVIGGGIIITATCFSLVASAFLDAQPASSVPNEHQH